MFIIYKCPISPIIIILIRLRWLFLSILILNLFFSSDIFNILNLFIVIEKVIILISIILAANLFLTITTTQEIIASLQWWFLPLTKLGFPTERLAVRIALVLDTVQIVQNFYTDINSDTNNKPTELFAKVLTCANTIPLYFLEIPELSKPPWWQWIYPLIILILILNDYL
ncbi:MAG TPA: hypothetical protein ENK59_00920 [Thioploca sp.]|nr:hypothetical protein [Thioploca sp.]